MFSANQPTSDPELPVGTDIGTSEGGVGGTSCSPPVSSGMSIFGSEAFLPWGAPQFELYTWITDAQAAALRQSHVLFPGSVSAAGVGGSVGVAGAADAEAGATDTVAGAGGSVTGGSGAVSSGGTDGGTAGAAAADLSVSARFLFSTLGTAAASYGSSSAALAQVLLQSYQGARYAWPQPWATRLGWPGEDNGGQLVRVVLKPEAWFAVLSSSSLSVVDAQSQQVPLGDALATPERIGAIFFEKDSSDGLAICGSGSFGVSADGFREYAIGNPAMVQEWSIGTQAIRDRLTANIAEITQFFAVTRACPVTSGAASWNQTVLCDWSGANPGSGLPIAPPTPMATDGSVPVTEEFEYEQALAIPSSNYLAAPEPLAAIIETLQGDLFDPDPLVVTSGSP